MRRHPTLLICLASLWLGACFEGGSTKPPQDSGTAVDTAFPDVADADPDDTSRSEDTASEDISPSDIGDSSTSCDAGLRQCGESCVDISNSIEHCGACDSPCQASDHEIALCEHGECAYKCEAGWADVDGDALNGCELECTPSNGGTETCDGQDNDCDGEVDEDDATNRSTFYADADDDGYGDPADTVEACEAPGGYVADNTDCDPADPNKHTMMTVYQDVDGDGFTVGGGESKCTDGTAPAGYSDTDNPDDCDDLRAAIHPDAEEVCDGQDNNCRNGADESAAQDALRRWADCDGDGYAPSGASSQRSCDEPAPPSSCPSSTDGTPGWTTTDPSTAADCRDIFADAHPGQTDFFASPMSGYTALLQWDYNCDGTVEEEPFPTNADCPICSGPDTDGWLDGAPTSCGQTAQWQNCDGSGGICDNSTTWKPLPCR